MAFPEDLSLARVGATTHPSGMESLLLLPDEAVGAPLNALVEDLDQHRASLAVAHRRLALHQAVTLLLSQAESVSEAYPRFLRTVCEGLEWEFSVIWTVDAGAELLRCQDAWHSPSMSGAALDAVARKTAFAHGVGLPGRVWAGKRPEWIAVANGSEPDSFERSAADIGLRTAAAFSIRCGEETIGVGALLCRAIREPDEEMLRSLEALGCQTGQFAARLRIEEQLRHDAFHDALTGLRNRTLFVDRLGRSLRRARQNAESAFAVLFLDLDRFKVVNDSLGHLAGDQLLVAIARRLEACLRPADTVARLGGDEFAILLDDVREIGDAQRVAERIQRKLALPFQLDGHEVFTTTSIGIAISAAHYEQPDELLRDADMAMYRAKALGKARHALFDAEMHTRAVATLKLESDLRRAVERQEFLVHYQPIVSLASGQVTGVEALLRWQHPERGMVPPAEFLPLAEETGLIAALGEWLLRVACAQNQVWHAAGHADLRLLVNLASRQLQDPELPALVSEVLRQTGLSPAALQLEVTETVAMQNVDRSIATMKALHAMGVRVSIDDFGTGYSSLGYLKRFPLHALKIGQSFVQQMTSDPDDAAITTAITALAHSLNLMVVAEGVETEEQLTFLRERQCDEFQGGLFSPPLPAERFAELIAEERHPAPAAPQEDA